MLEIDQRGEFLRPLHIIDFEATSLDMISYPIEVGIATLRPTELQHSVWSTLIKPAPAWNLAGTWDPDAERIHKINLRELQLGLDAASVMLRLNSIVGAAGHAWVGDDKYDLLWFAVLCDAALPVHPSFTVAGLSEFTSGHPRFAQAITSNLGRTAAPHRAGPDAERFLLAATSAVREIRYAAI